MNTDLIKEWEHNWKPFNAMSPELQALAREIGLSHFECYLGLDDAEWGEAQGFLIYRTYRLRPDYEEKPEMVECRVDGCCYIWVHPNGTEERISLSKAIDDIRFIGFKYEIGCTSISPRVYDCGDKIVACVHDLCISESVASGEYEVLTPTAVLFRSTK
jgi:hypothetical protein